MDMIWKLCKGFIQITAIESSGQYTTIKVQVEGCETEMYILAVYSKCHRVGQRLLWDEMKRIGDTITKPWLVCGDFNVTFEVERRLRSSKGN